MTTIDKIGQQVLQLPQSFQREVLAFVEFLLDKSRRELGVDEDTQWSSMSLASAMRGIEDEDGPGYEESDLKERWE